MPRTDLIEIEGVVENELGYGKYRVLPNNGAALVTAQLGGRMRRHHIKVVAGDSVRVAVSPYDMTNGLIVYRG